LKPKVDPDQNFLERIKLIQNKKLPDTTQAQLKPATLLPKQIHKRRNKGVREPSPIKPGRLSSFRTISRGTYYKVNSVRDPPPP